MAFLNPLLLFGMLAVSIPIIIHLLNKRKFDRVVWAAMHFLRASIEKNQRRLKIEDLILLLLRCALLILLAIALARPALKGASGAGWFGPTKITAVLILDNTPSMSQTDGVTSRFDRAKEALRQAMDTFPSGSSVAVILASDMSDPVIPEPTYDLSLAKKAIADARLCDRSSNLFQSISDAVALLEQKAGDREIFIATDGQLLAFQQINDITHLLDQSKNDVRAQFLLTGQKEAQNLSVSDLRMGSDIPAVGAHEAFDVEITNWGRQDENNVRVTLAVDGEAAGADAIIDNIPAGQSRAVALSIKLRSDDYHIITAAVPADHLPADDARSIAVKGISKVNVLLVDGNPGIEPRDGEVFFLRHAMTPVPAAQLDDYVIKTETVTSSGLAAANLNDYQVIALADVADMSDRTLESIAGFVRNGGGLLIFPGDDIRRNFYNDQMLGKYALLPAELGDTAGQADRQTESFRLAGRPLTHPIVSVWGDPEAGDLASAHFYKRYLLKPAPKTTGTLAKDAGEPRVVLAFLDQQPFMIERPYGQGRVFLFASTARPARWNDLPDHPGIWVPLMYRTLGWIVLQQNRQLNVKVGEPWIIHPSLDLLGKEALIGRPGDSAAAIRDSRQIEMDADGRPSLRFEQTSLAGEYDVSIGGGKPIKFAVQPDKNESSLDDINESQRVQLAGSATVLDWTAGMDVKPLISQQRDGKEYWLPVAVAVLLLGTLETFLAGWFSRPK